MALTQESIPIDIVPIIAQSDLDTLQDAMVTVPVDNLQDPTSVVTDASQAESQDETTSIQDMTTPTLFKPSMVILQEATTEQVSLPEATLSIMPTLPTVMLQEATSEHFALPAATTNTLSIIEGTASSVLPEVTLQGALNTPTSTLLIEDPPET